jgi:hypothetical protein
MRDFASRHAQLAIFPKTKFHIQKFNTFRVLEKQSRTIKFYNSTVQRPSPKRATSNRVHVLVFGIRAEKGGVLSAFCDYACTVPARTGKGILPVYGFTIHSERRRSWITRAPNLLTSASAVLPETKFPNLKTEAHGSGLELKFGCYIFYSGNPDT